MAKKLLEIKISEYNLDKIIMKETEKFAKEYPEQMEKAMWKDNFAYLAFKILANRIRTKLIEKSVVNCLRCHKVTRADILHTCSPGDWKPIKVDK